MKLVGMSFSCDLHCKKTCLTVARIIQITHLVNLIGFITVFSMESLWSAEGSCGQKGSGVTVRRFYRDVANMIRVRLESTIMGDPVFFSLYC